MNKPKWYRYEMDFEVVHEWDCTIEEIQIRNENLLFSVAIELYI